MATDARDVGEFQKGLNDAAGKASVLWTTFLTFELYLAIAFGSVTHRDLLLETPIKLPLANVDLPLVGFFVVAPVVLIISHFYVFLQLAALASKAGAYDELLKREVRIEVERQSMRQRLDAFLVLQFLVGPKSQREGVGGFSLRFIAWITLVAAPVVVLLQAQITFLPYHREWVSWMQRIVITADIVLILYFWTRLRVSDKAITGESLTRVWVAFGVGLSILVPILSFCVITFPHELLDRVVPAVRFVPVGWAPKWSDQNAWTSLHEVLFAGTVDEVVGRPRSLFSNRLVVSDQSFVDPDKIDKVEFTRSFRGRDLRRAVFNRADLRKADFRGAMLNEASFLGARLQFARFDCPKVGLLGGCVEGEPVTWLQDTSFDRADLQSSSFRGARLEGAHLYGANLANSVLDQVHAEGAWFYDADLRGASLASADLSGSSLGEANLRGADLAEAVLKGTALSNANLECASLNSANLTAASLYAANLQGSDLAKTDLTGATLGHARLLRTRGIPKLHMTDLSNIDLVAVPWAGTINERGNPGAWKKSLIDIIADKKRREEAKRCAAELALLPSLQDDDRRAFWQKALGEMPFQNRRAEYLLDVSENIACRSSRIARGLLKNGVATELGLSLQQFEDRLRGSKCPAIMELDEDDWENLRLLQANVARPQ